MVSNYTYINICCGRVAQWLGRQTYGQEVASSSRHMGVNNLPKVVTQQHHGREATVLA